MENYEIVFESLLVMLLCFCCCFSCCFLFLLMFLVKSYGKLRNCFLKVCWLCFGVSVGYVSVAVFVSVAVLKQFLNTRTAHL